MGQRRLAAAGDSVSGRSHAATIDPSLPNVFVTPHAIDPTLPADVFVSDAPRVQVAAASTLDSRGRPRARLRESGRLRAGATIDKYRIEELLGVGGFAVVYRATHMLLSIQVALKLLRSDVVARRPQLAAQLLQEARFAARIDHPNVVKVLDVTHTADIT